jgi:hypothetical protein
MRACHGLTAMRRSGAGEVQRRGTAASRDAWHRGRDPQPE